MTRARKGLGQRGEGLAAAYLEAHGLKIVARNIRTPVGEIDLLGLDGPVWVFIEVRTRRGGAYGTPEESITRTKQARMLAAAQHYIQNHNLQDADWRIDAVAVELSASGAVQRIELIRSAEEG